MCLKECCEGQPVHFNHVLKSGFYSALVKATNPETTATETVVCYSQPPGAGSLHTTQATRGSTRVGQEAGNCAQEPLLWGAGKARWSQDWLVWILSVALAQGLSPAAWHLALG